MPEPIRHADDSTEAPPRAKLACRGVWKLFGEGAREVIARHGGAPTPEQIAAEGVVGAVQMQKA